MRGLADPSSPRIPAHRLPAEIAATHRTLSSRWERLKERVTRTISAGVDDYSLRGGTYRHTRGRFDLQVELSRHSVSLRGLPDAFAGLRIVQLTDIHHGLFLPLYAVMEAVELANQMKPDVVVLTGDFVTYSRAYIEPVAEILGGIEARLGAFAVLGNHDFRAGADHVARALRRREIDVLRNRHTWLRYRGQRLAVAGVDDLWNNADLPRALHGTLARDPVLLLSHNPRIIRTAAPYGVSLIFSGHTHGGQVQLPVVGSIFGRKPERMRFRMGWDRLGPTQIYVSRGIGTVVLPVRYRCPAEIPQFTLRAAHS